MGPHRRRVDLNLVQVGITYGFGLPFPHSRSARAVKSLPNSVWLAVAGRKVFLSNAGTQERVQAVDDQGVVDRGPLTALPPEVDLVRLPTSMIAE